MTRKEQIRYVRKRPHSIHRIKDPHPDVQWSAVFSHPTAIKHIQYPARHVQLYAIRHHPDVIAYIKHIAFDTVLEYIKISKGLVNGYMIPAKIRLRSIKTIQWDTTDFTQQQIVKLVTLDLSIYNCLPKRYHPQELELLSKLS
jgi:hypothetical protein